MITDGKCVLIVQSRDITCLGLQCYLEICGLRLASCLRATQLAVARRQLADQVPDLVIVDPFMEQGDGYFLLRSLRDFKPAPLSIAYAGHFRMEDIQTCFEAGAAAVLSHGADDKAVIKTLIDVLGGTRRIIATSGEGPLDRLNSAWRISPTLLEKLSAQQREVFRLLGAAVPVKEIASKLKISARSIETYEARLKEALCLKSNSSLRRAAILHHAWVEVFAEKAQAASSPKTARSGSETVQVESMIQAEQ